MQKTRAQHASNQDATAGLGGIRRLFGKGVAWVEIVLILKLPWALHLTDRGVYPGERLLLKESGREKPEC